MPSDDMSKLHEVLKSSRNVVAVCGAGLSAASGIPTFRGAGGLWRKYDAMSLATPEAFKANPCRSWAFYEYRRRKLVTDPSRAKLYCTLRHWRSKLAIQASPNEAHRVLSRFADAQRRAAVAPACETFNLITQNVDGLSRRSAAELRSSPLDDSKIPFFEMHGTVLEQRCTRCSEVTTFAEDAPIAPSLENIIQEVESNGPEVNIPLADLPNCTKCTGQSSGSKTVPRGQALLRPNVVWFGETPKHLEEIDQILKKTDLMLVVGTSSTVYPAAGFAARARRAGARVAVFNLKPSPGEHIYQEAGSGQKVISHVMLFTRCAMFTAVGDDEADFVFYGPCEETLPKALGL